MRGKGAERFRLACNLTGHMEAISAIAISRTFSFIGTLSPDGSSGSCLFSALVLVVYSPVSLVRFLAPTKRFCRSVRLSRSELHHLGPQSPEIRAAASGMYLALSPS
jgi:hypothetical protein